MVGKSLYEQQNIPVKHILEAKLARVILFIVVYVTQGISEVIKGEYTGKRAILTQMCAYLRRKTKSVTVGFVCSDGVSNVTLNVQLLGTCAIGPLCQIAHVRKDT